MSIIAGTPTRYAGGGRCALNTPNRPTLPPGVRVAKLRRMSSSTVVDVPHSLGREEARRRIKSRIGDLASHIPGGFAEVKSAWTSDYTLALEVSAMGQGVSASLDIQDTLVRVTMQLPLMLSFMSGVIANAVKEQGGRLLLPDGRA